MQLSYKAYVMAFLQTRIFLDRLTLKVSRENLSFGAHESAALQKIAATAHLICVNQN